MLSAAPLPARIIITEIIPGVNTTATAGDTVELYNTGPGAVDLTGWILSDLDPASVETDPTTELSFAPLAIGLPPLQPGEFAVIIFTLDTGTAGFIDTNFGLRVTAPLLVSGGMFDATWEQLVLFDDATPTPVAIDSVVWRDDGGPPSNLADTLDDLAALTPATQPAGFTFTLSVDGRWSGPDAIPDQATYSANAIDFTGWTAVSTYGGGVLRRVSVGNIFSEGAPDGPAQWQAVDRTDATLGNFSGLVPAPGGFLPILETDDITVRVIALKSSNHPERRIDTAQDVNRFTEPSAGDITAWRAVMAAANDQQWVDVFGLAEPLGYELVEFLDIATGATFHILQEEVEPGDPGYRGLGIFVLDASPGVDPNLVLQAPHPIHDSLTLDELGLAIPQLRPRASLIAGTHRKNHTTETTCDGTFEDNSKYRISDVAHHTQNFFEPAHEELEAAVANTCVIQFHGFCGCNYPALTHDAVVSNGVGAPALSAAARVIAARIDAQNFIADDGLGGDQTTAAIFGVDTASLGATNNLQGRITNFVAAGDICDTAAVAASERFIHIEQDLDVREEPQHIIDAIAEAIAIIKSVATPSPTSTATPTPSATASQTPSPTPSRTPTAINSPTSSVTPSPTPSGTASPTPSATITPTASATPSVTAPSRTPTPSPSTTPTASASSTSSPSTSPTPSPTVTISATSSPTAPANAALDWEIYQ